MMSADHTTGKVDEVGISVRDILFECPSCGKSLVVDESAEGLIVDCPQCQSNVIVPPKQSKSVLAPPPQTTRARVSKEEIKPAAAKLDSADPSVQKRLGVLADQLKELQAQRTEVANRLASRMNDINRDLVLMARLETSQQQILKEWSQLADKISDPRMVSTAGVEFSKPAIVGSSLTAGGPTHVSFRE
jgi:DNA-directed RNA polymerase subunit RPC12/RpoP